MTLNLPKGEWVSVLKGALVAGGGVALTYVGQHLGGLDFGAYTPMVVGVLSVAINVLRKQLTALDPEASVS